MKKIKLWYAIGAGILIIGVIGSICMLQTPEKAMVEIVQDGSVLYQLNLEDFREPTTIEIEYDAGKNTVLIENGDICISHANCPDQTCVKMGYLQSSSLPIVCLPHRLVIQYANDDADALDGMTN